MRAVETDHFGPLFEIAEEHGKHVPIEGHINQAGAIYRAHHTNSRTYRHAQQRSTAITLGLCDCC
jgi:hypothetical protein